MEKSTADPLLDREILQPENGYRYSIDPFILAGQIRSPIPKKIIDIGCGCGVLPILLAGQYPKAEIVGIEIQEELARYAEENIRRYKYTDRIRIIVTDIADLSCADFQNTTDLIVSNPPYKKRGSGRLNPNPQKAVARHEITLDMPRLFEAASALLSGSGSICVIYPVERLQDVVQTAPVAGLTLRSLTFVHPRPDKGAILFVACLGKRVGDRLRVLDPFYIHNLENKPTDAYISLFQYV